MPVALLEGGAAGYERMPIVLAESIAAIAGAAWPVFAPLVGGLGAFVAGSNTVSNMMFVLFQFGVAERIAVDPMWIVAMQAVGGAAGNVICVHNVVAASAVAGLIGREGAIIRMTFLPFAYYVVMFLSESAAKGHRLPAGIARWMPNLVLGPLGVAELFWRARHAEGRLPLRLPLTLPRWLAMRLPAGRRAAAEASNGPAPSAQAAARAVSSRRVVVVVRFPRIGLPNLSLIDRYISRLYMRVVGLSFLALLGLFYISTFIDLVDKLVSGCYAARGNFRLFTAFAMLYFAAATTDERRRAASGR